MKIKIKGSDIIRLFPDLGENAGGLTKETHLVKKEGRNYVLRICKKTQIADFYETLSQQLEKYGFLPRLLNRKGKRVLYEYIPGRDAQRKDALKVAYQIGRIAGRISETRFSRQKIVDFDKEFHQKLRYLIRKKVLDKQTAIQIKQRYGQLRKKVHPRISLELSDPSIANFRLFQRKIYLVDIHSIQLDIKGRGFAKALTSWLKTRKQREKFKQGYNSVSSMSFLTETYLEFIYLYHLVINIALKFHGHRDYTKQFRKLNKLLKIKLK